ncbi:MAG: hypothetical protein M1828_006965 [Chrysothrix sp. TS-e1954]|nr:MAG: hypothetical protein M1828_006965 [Chrysothrix sp. TS-e1954]
MPTVSHKSTVVGVGQFGLVFTTPRHQSVAFKVLRRAEQAPALAAEYTAASTIHASTFASAPKFTIPKPIGIFHPAGEERPPDLPKESSSGDITQHSSSCASDVFEELAPTRAAYAMDRIPLLPTSLSDALLSLCDPLKQRTPLTMCRLLFGQDPSRSAVPWHSWNFPININIYKWLRFKVPSAALPEPTVIAAGMGQIMAKVHNAGYDCRGVEFTLAGSPQKSTRTDHSEPLQMGTKCEWGLYAFDFDQMSRLPNTLNEQINLMGTAFFSDDPFFPQPRSGDDLYESFKSAYIAESGLSERTYMRLNDFLYAIEMNQQRLDAAR